MPSSPDPAAVSATYSTCQLSPYLKMILGSSARGQAPSSLPLLVFGIEDTPSSFSFGFSFCISAFPLVLFKDFQSHQLCHCKADVCSATCPALPGSSRPSPLSSWQYLAAKLLLDLGCSRCPSHPSSFPSSTVTMVAFLSSPLAAHTIISLCLVLGMQSQVCLPKPDYLCVHPHLI